jgi:predicted nucleic acid-binding protein
VNFPDRKAFCDTSFFFASLVPEDVNYERAGDILAFCKENALTLCTTWDVISETVTLLRYRASYRLAMQFLDTIKPALFVVRYDCFLLSLLVLGVAENFTLYQIDDFLGDVGGMVGDALQMA